MVEIREGRIAPMRFDPERLESAAEDIRTEQRISVLERQVRSLRREVQQKGELLDTIASPPWKRFWWFLCGYRLWRVGRWYWKTEDLK